MTTPRITTLAARVKARQKDHASIPAHIANLLAVSRTPIFDWAADVDIALASLGRSCDELRARMQGRSPVIVPTSAPLAARFIDNGDGTISDNNTGLMWQAGPGARLDWKLANSFCREECLGGHNDWRLPTIEELYSIVDYERHAPACDPVFGALSDHYWSASTGASSAQFAWSVDFGDGDVGANFKTTNSYVRAVRGGK